MSALTNKVSQLAATVQQQSKQFTPIEAWGETNPNEKKNEEYNQVPSNSPTTSILFEKLTRGEDELDKNQDINLNNDKIPSVIELDDNKGPNLQKMNKSRPYSRLPWSGPNP